MQPVSRVPKNSCETTSKLFTFESIPPNLFWETFSYVFYKIGILKNFAKLTRAHRKFLRISVFVHLFWVWQSSTVNWFFSYKEFVIESKNNSFSTMSILMFKNVFLFSSHKDKVKKPSFINVCSGQV